MIKLATPHATQCTNSSSNLLQIAAHCSPRGPSVAGPPSAPKKKGSSKRLLFVRLVIVTRLQHIKTGPIRKSCALFRDGRQGARRAKRARQREPCLDLLSDQATRWLQLQGRAFPPGSPNNASRFEGQCRPSTARQVGLSPASVRTISSPSYRALTLMGAILDLRGRLLVWQDSCLAEDEF